MTTMTIRIPDDVKAAFDKAFEGEDKDAVIAALLRHAAEEKAHAASAAEDLARRRREAVDSLNCARERPISAMKTSNGRVKKAVRDVRRRRKLKIILSATR